MQIVRESTGDGITRLDEIMHLYTLPMLRVCGLLPDPRRRELTARMARHRLEEELATRPSAAAPVRVRSRPTRRRRWQAARSPAMTLAS
jgi:hypothetical protein